MVRRREQESIDVPGAAALPYAFRGSVPQAGPPIAVVGEAIVDFVLEPAAMADRAVALHVGGLGVAVEPQASAIATLVREAGPETLVVVDPNCAVGVARAGTTYRDRLRDVMCLADVVKASTEDRGYLDPDRTPHQTARALLERGPAVVLLTDGSRGATVLTARYEALVEAPFVEVVDTIGAGRRRC